MQAIPWPIPLEEPVTTTLGAVLDRARSVIVDSEGAASAVRRLRSDGAPVLVLPSVEDGGWTINDVVAALLDWLDGVNKLAAGIVHRVGPAADAAPA